MEEIFLSATDGYQLCVHVFAVANAKAVVQVIHGMEEHQARYEPVVAFLNQHGYSVVTSDLRGHGHHATDLGYFADKNGYQLLIQDQQTITAYITEHFPNLPINLLAHSMGTLITRVLLQTDSQKYHKVVFTGYPTYQAVAKLGIVLANLTKACRGAKYKAEFFQNLSITAFNKKIKNTQTTCDWICANPATIQAYLDDPLCGFSFTCSAFGDLFHLVVIMHQPKRYTQVNTTLPILMLRGTDDPCTGGIKGATASQKTLRRAGFTNITAIDYPEMRHEILNEIDHQKVYDDILSFYAR